MARHRRRPVARLAEATREDVEKKAWPVIANTPALPPVDFGTMGQAAPGLPANPDSLPAVDAIVICWAEAEWAPLHHVFVDPATATPYADASNATWPGWKQYAKGVPASSSRSAPTYWGYYRLVTVNGKNVLLFK